MHSLFKQISVYLVFLVALGGCGLGLSTGDSGGTSSSGATLRAGLLVSPLWQSAQVSWAAEAQAAGYLTARSRSAINWSPADNVTYHVGQTVADDVIVAYLGSQSSFTDSGLLNNQVYHYAAFPFTSGPHYLSGQSGSGNPGPHEVANAGGRAYRVTTVGTRAYVAKLDSGLEIFDVSDPTHPTKLGNYHDGKTVYASFVDGNYAYVAENTDGMIVLDVSQPSAPKKVGALTTSAGVLGLYESGGVAYLAASGSGLLTVDVSRPSAPALLGSYDTAGTAAGVVVRANVAYVADQGQGLVAIDVSHPATPALLGTAAIPSDYSQSIALNGNYAFLADYGSKLRVVDITNPAAPALVGTQTATGYGFDIAASGNYAFLAADTGGLNVFDVSTPSAPVRIATFASSHNIQGISLVGSTAYLGDWMRGLIVADLSTPASPAQIGGNDTAFDAYSLATYNGYLIVGGNDLTVLDVSVTPPRQIGAVALADMSLQGMAVSGSRAYVSELGGLEVIDLSTPSAPVSLGTYTSGTITWGYGIYLKGTFAYLADPFSGVHVIDVSNPASMSEVRLVPTSNPMSIVGAGNYAYVENGNTLSVIDISTPASAAVVATLSTNGFTLAMGSGYLYNGGTDLEVIAISNPLAPAVVGTVSDSGITDISYTGGLVYGATSGGSTVYDVSQPASPRIVSKLATASAAEKALAFGGLLYFSNGAPGITVIGPVPAP